MSSIQRPLWQNPVEASAPCRIDSGGTWDIKAMALPFERIDPVTVNVALNLRTSVLISPYKKGWVKISSRGFSHSEAFPKDKIPFDSSFGLFFAAVSYFGFHGMEIHISSESPVKSALGGSSVALVALIKALSKINVRQGERDMSPGEILHLAYHLEDGIGGGNCGLQDHAAAVYGGVHLWRWHPGHRTKPLERTSLLDRKRQKEMSKRLLVAYSGKAHVSAATNRNWIRDFHSAQTREGWLQVNEIVHRMALAVKKQDWQGAAGLLQEEMSIRREITPEALIPVTSKLIDQAEALGCGARFAGAGAGGALWALGQLEDIRKLRKIWEDTLYPVKDAMILDCQIDPLGAR